MNEQFLKTCTDMELVVLQKQARDVEDQELLTLVLKEMGRRQRENK